MRINPAVDGTDARPTMQYIPFDQMTVLQQAEHLVHAHGFDDEYYQMDRGVAVPDWATSNDALVTWWATETTPRYRRSMHDEDHADYAHGGAPRMLHTHDKTA